MSGRGSWIAVAGAGLAVILWIVLTMRGPASGRAPAQHQGLPEPAGEAAAPADAARVRIAVAVVPSGSVPEWVLEVRDSVRVFREERGSGARECTIALPPGAARCAVRALGFVGESRRIEIEPGKEVAATLTLRRLGRVAGVVRCDGAPAAGVLVRIAMPVELADLRPDLMSEDRGPGMEQAIETDSSGTYRFANLPPGPGYTLVAASFDHPPVRVGPIESRAGEETTVDITVVVGGHLAGRVVDLTGAPSKGTTVNVLQRHDKRGAVAWDDEARARTDEDGRFVTPALAPPAMRMLKAWIVEDGVQQVIQLEALPPDRGTKDVGTLAPHPGVVSFELEGPVGDPPCTLTLSVHGDPPGTGQTVMLAGAAFDREGRVRLAGLPVGKGSYTALSGDAAAFVEGEFLTTGRDMTVKVPPLKERAAQPPPAETLTVDVPEQSGTALVVLIADGAVVFSRRVEKGGHEPVVERVSPGRYTLFVCAGDRYGRKEIIQVAGRDLRTSITPDRVGRSVTVLVLDEGKPVPGATVSVRGFRREAKGMNAPWAETGSDGRAVLRGLPPDTEGMSIMARTADIGRRLWIDVGGKDEVTIDIAKSQGDD